MTIPGIIRLDLAAHFIPAHFTSVHFTTVHFILTSCFRLLGIGLSFTSSFPSAPGSARRTLYDVQHTPYILHSTSYTVRCIVYNLQHRVYIVEYMAILGTLYGIQGIKQYNVRGTQCIQYILHVVYVICTVYIQMWYRILQRGTLLCDVHCIMYAVHYILYIVICTTYTI